jgi:hypothetical protein
MAQRKELVEGTKISLYNQAKWSRTTVADGKWLQNETLEPISANDRILASAIDYVSGGVDNLSTRIDFLTDATDVINVYGNWDDFINNSGLLFETSAITNNDIIKVLNDKNGYPNPLFPHTEDLTSGHQTYFRWSADNAHTQWPLDPTEGQWEFIGYLEPYYNKNEVDTIIGDLSGTVDNRIEDLSGTVDNRIEDLSGTVDNRIEDLSGTVNNRINNLSATVSNNYLSANENAVNAGKNIKIDYDPNNPKITIKTEENVEFNNVSSKNISATNVTALTAQGNSAKFTNISSNNISATNLNDIVISDLFGSAYSGAAASAYITAHSADFLNSAHSAYGTLTFGTKAYPATNSSYNFTFNAGQEINFTTGNNQVTIGVTDNLITSANAGSAASAWVSSHSAGLNIQGGYGISTDTNENGNLVINIRNNGCDYAEYGLALGESSTAIGAPNGPNAFAFGDYCYAHGANAFAAGCHSTAGKFAVAMGWNNVATGDYSLALGYNSTAERAYTVAIGRGLSGEAPITLGTWNDNVAGATFIIGDGTGTQEGYDVVRKNALVIKDGLVSGRDFSAGNVSLSSLTNMSAFGNGITNTATFNLSAVKLSAGQGIGFKNDTNGVLSISAEGRAYTGENYVKVDNTTKKISVTGDLITSAKAGSAASAWVNNTLFDFSYYEGSTDPETAKGSIDKITILYKNDADTHDVMHNQEMVFERGGCRVSGLLIQAAKNTDNGKVLTYNSTANNYTWQAIPPSTYSNEDGYILINNENRKINLSTTGIKTSAYSATYNGTDGEYHSELNGEKLRFSHGMGSLNISLLGITRGGTGSTISAKWDNLFENHAKVNRELLSDSNLTADKVNFVVATDTQPYKSVNFIVTSTLPRYLSANVYYII